MTVKVQIKQVYGVERIYILTDEFKNVHRNLSGKKTIDRNDINQYKQLGIKFEVQAESL